MMPMQSNQQVPPQGMQPPQGMFAQMAQSQMPPVGSAQTPNPGMNQVASQGQMALRMLQHGAPATPQLMQAVEAYIKTFGNVAQEQFNQAASQRLSKQGRNGDTMVAHLTPGEKTVPPEVQTPKVLATLNKAYKEKGVSPEQFTVGSPQSSQNPSTGLPEYNFMSAFLPAALGIAGSVAAPYLAPELLGATSMSPALLGAIGGGLGTTVGGLAAGQSPTQAALSGIGSGAGGYMMGNLGNGLTLGGSVPGQAAAMPNGDVASLVKAGMTPDQIGKMPGGAAALGQLAPAAAAPAASTGGMSIFGQKINPMGMAGSALGGYLGNQMGAPSKPTQPNYPPGFNTPMTPVGQLPSAQTQLGQNTSKQPMPSFNGFNPNTNYPASYNFFPTATNGL